MRANRALFPSISLLGWLSVGLLSLGAAPLAVAQGSDTVEAETLVVLAKEEPGKVDPELAQLPGLRRPPFNAYRSMSVLTRHKHQLAVGKPVDIELPNGRRLRIVLQRELPDGRFRVQASINRPDHKDYLPLLTVVASPGDPFFVAGQAHEGGTLVIGVRLGAKQ